MANKKTKLKRTPNYVFVKQDILDRVSTTDDQFKVEDIAGSQYKKLTQNAGGISEQGTKINKSLLQRYEDALDFLINQKPQLDHPVGSFEINNTGTNPADYLGFGTWEELEQGTILMQSSVAGGDNKLTSSNLPKHTHTISHTHTKGSMRIQGSASCRRWGNWENFEQSGALAMYAQTKTTTNLGSTWGDDATPVGVSLDTDRGGWSGSTSEPSNTSSGDGGFANQSIDNILKKVVLHIFFRTA